MKIYIEEQQLLGLCLDLHIISLWMKIIQLSPCPQMVCPEHQNPVTPTLPGFINLRLEPIEEEREHATG